jgi:hypothetical protein
MLQGRIEYYDRQKRLVELLCCGVVRSGPVRCGAVRDACMRALLWEQSKGREEEEEGVSRQKWNQYAYRKSVVSYCS